MTERAHVCRVKPSCKLAPRVRRLQVLKSTEHECHIGCPRRQELVHTSDAFLASAQFWIVLVRPPDDAAVRKDDLCGAIWSIKTNDHIAVAGQILGERG